MEDPTIVDISITLKPVILTKRGYRLFSPEPCVLSYGCETWSLALGEEHTLKVFENRVLRRIFGPKRDEMTGGRRKLHNEELQ
jgi:hypothetical protein